MPKGNAVIVIQIKKVTLSNGYVFNLGLNVLHTYPRLSVACHHARRMIRQEYLDGVTDEH